MLKKFVLVCCVLLAPTAYAGQGSGKITFLLINKFTPAWVVFNVETTTNHACGTPSSLGRWRVDLTTATGQEMVALLLSAEARQVPIKVSGVSVCGEQNREVVDYIYVGDPTL